MDLEDITFELSRPIEALDTLNQIFENELIEGCTLMTKPELKKFFDVLFAYNYITHLISKNLFEIREKYQQYIEDKIESHLTMSEKS